MSHEPMKSILDFPNYNIYFLVSYQKRYENKILLLSLVSGKVLKLVCKLRVYWGSILALVHELVFLIDPFH